MIRIKVKYACYQKGHVDLVDFGPPDLDHTHVTNARPSISLVKSNGCEFNCTLGESWKDTWLPVDAPMKIRRRKSRRKWAHVMESWSTYLARRGNIVAVQAFFSESDGLNILR